MGCGCTEYVVYRVGCDCVQSIECIEWVVVVQSM